jgi:hypothetical protein
VLTRLYMLLCKLYPRDYRVCFGAEMLNTFASAAQERRTQGAGMFTQLALTELLGLARGVAGEWIAKLATDSSVRGRCLPDVQKMRPTGVPRELWFTGRSAPGGHSPGLERGSGQRRTAG